MSGFVPDPGTDYSYGHEPEISRRLDALAKHLGVTIYGLSGQRTPAHSVAVGGFPNDPHTRGEASDIGVNSQTRSSAGGLTETQLNVFGLTRPFPGSAEVNHIQLLPGSDGPKGGQAAPSSSSTPGAGGFSVSDLTDPSKFAGDVINAIVQPLEQQGLRILLYAVLILGGVGLIVGGTLQATKPEHREALMQPLGPALEGV